MASVVRRCPKRIVTLPACTCQVSQRRLYTASARASPSPKILTIPFVLEASRARSWLEYAASFKFGPVAFVLHALHKWLNWPRTSPVSTIAFRAVLLPVWKVDLSARGQGTIDGVEMDMSFQSVDATLPGFKMNPLDKLPLNAPWEDELVEFDPAEHSHQADMDVTIIPFSLSPRKLIDKLKALPRARESEQGMSVDPSSFRTSLFAFYPVYIPIFLGEFEVQRSMWPASDMASLPRATVAQIATTASKAFAIYDSRTSARAEGAQEGAPRPNWEPGGAGETFGFAFGGIPKKHDERPSPEALKSIVPRIKALITAATDGSGGTAAGGGVSTWLDPLVGDGNETWNDERCMSYVPHSMVNRVWIENDSELRAAEAMLRSLDSLSDDDDKLKAVVVGKGGRVNVSTGKKVKDDLRGQIAKHRQVVEHTRPDWLKALEASRLDEARSRANRGR